MSDALAVAAYLNVFIRTNTEIACLAQVSGSPIKTILGDELHPPLLGGVFTGHVLTSPTLA